MVKTDEKMRIVNHRIITEPHLIKKIVQRRQQSIEELQACGFQHFGYISETMSVETRNHFPLFWLTNKLIVLLLPIEVTHYQFPFHVERCDVVMQHHSPPTYATTFGLGTLFITGFVHGGLLITSTNQLFPTGHPERGYYCFGTGKDIRTTWGKHRQELGKLEYEGHIPEENLNFDHYTYLSELSDSMALKLMPKKKA